MKRATLLLVLLIVSMFSASVLAHSEHTEDFTIMQQQMVGQELQGSIGKYFADERINIRVGLETGQDINFGIETKNKIISSFEQTVLEDPSFEIFTTEQTLNSIMENNDPIISIAKALNEGTIQYKAHGLFNKIKYGIIVSILKNKAR